MKNLLTALILMCAAASMAQAAPISYVYTGTGSGTLDGVSFSNAPFKITANADTASVVSCGVDCQSVDHTSASVNLNGNTYAITTGTRTYFVTGFGVGLARGGSSGANLYQALTGALGAWDMISNIGPLSVGFQLLQWSNSPQIVTSGGTLIFSDAPAVSGSFKACLGTCEPPAAPTPIPTLSEWVMLMLAGLIGIFGFARLRRT